MMVHIADAVQDGHQSVMTRSTDTDVVVLVVATLDLKELWVSYGTRKNHRILLVHLFAKALGPSKSNCLPIFHALTGCDTTSFVAGRTLQMLQGHFSSWQGPPSNISEENLCTIKRFVILICDGTSHFSKVGVNLEKSRFLFEN